MVSQSDSRRLSATDQHGFESKHTTLQANKQTTRHMLPASPNFSQFSSHQKLSSSIRSTVKNFENIRLQILIRPRVVTGEKPVPVTVQCGAVQCSASATRMAQGLQCAMVLRIGSVLDLDEHHHQQPGIRMPATATAPRTKTSLLHCSVRHDMSNQSITTRQLGSTGYDSLPCPCCASRAIGVISQLLPGFRSWYSVGEPVSKRLPVFTHRHTWHLRVRVRVHGGRKKEGRTLQITYSTSVPTWV